MALYEVKETVKIECSSIDTDIQFCFVFEMRSLSSSIFVSLSPFPMFSLFLISAFALLAHSRTFDCFFSSFVGQKAIQNSGNYFVGLPLEFYHSSVQKKNSNHGNKQSILFRSKFYRIKYFLVKTPTINVRELLKSLVDNTIQNAFFSLCFCLNSASCFSIRAFFISNYTNNHSQFFCLTFAVLVFSKQSYEWF